LLRRHLSLARPQLTGSNVNAVSAAAVPSTVICTSRAPSRSWRASIV
jgi:hypothetical protein